MKLSVDFGGTTYSYAIFDENNLIFKSKSYDIKKFNNYKDLLLELKNNVYLRCNAIDYIGIACPGPLDSKSGQILNTPNLKILQYVNLKEEVKTYFNCSKVSVENDANVFALGGYKILECKNEDVLLGITLGTGIGFGIIINSKLFRGSYGMAGEYEPSPLENNISWAEKIGYKFFINETKRIFNKNLSPLDLYNLADNNDKNAIQIWNQYGENIGLCLSHVINLINPNYITIGGGVSKGSKHFNKKLIETLEDKCFIYKKEKINISYDKNCLNVYYGNLFTIE